MRRATVAAIVALSSAGAWASQAPAVSPAPESALVSAVDRAVSSEMTRTGAPGVAVVVVERGRVLLAKGYGFANVETGARVDPGTLFQIGSVTKAFTALAAISASLDGTLPLDTPIGEVVSGIDPCLRRPTVAQLLAHTGGIIDEPAEYGPQGEEGLAAYPRTWTSEYCLLPPGRAFSYSNSGYALAGLALQEKERKPFADLVTARVLDPLGMRRTTFRPTDAMTWPLAVGHRRIEGGAIAVARPLPNDARLWPAGTLYSSASEMGRFLAALTNEGRVEGSAGIPPAVIATLIEKRAERPTVAGPYGYGVEIDRFAGETRVGHAGSMTGYGGLFSLLPARGVAVAVLANGDGAILPTVADAALSVFAGPSAAGARGATLVVSAPAAPPIPSDSYVGSYANPRRFTVDVAATADGLVLRRFGRDFPMRRVSNELFVVQRPRGGDETIAFGFGPDGRADYLQMAIWALARKR